MFVMTFFPASSTPANGSSKRYHSRSKKQMTIKKKHRRSPQKVYRLVYSGLIHKFQPNHTFLKKH